RGRLDDDSTDADLMRWTPESPVGMPRGPMPRSTFGRYLVGSDPELFLANYAAIGPLRKDVLGGRPVTVAHYARADGSQSAHRWIAVDDATGEVVQLEDRSYDGTPLRRATLSISMEVHRRVPAGPAAPKTVDCLTPAEAAREASFPVYEPARLPDGYRRLAVNYAARGRTMPE